MLVPLRIVSAAVLLAAALAVPSLAASGELSNRRAPGWNLPDGKLERYDLQDYRGKVVLIEFLQSNCPHCVELSATLEQLRQRYGSRIQIFGVVIYPPETQATVSKFIAEHKIGYPILFDSSQMAASYLVRNNAQNPKFEVPHLFVIDPAGKIRNDYAHTDVVSLDAKVLGAVIDALAKPGTAESSHTSSKRTASPAKPQQ